MIVAETEDGFRFVTQPDHAALAGRFADHWGGAFDPPEPSPSVAIAAHTHDDGWWAYDRRPRLGDDGTPQTFTELPPASWIALYDEGIDAAAGLDPYVGFLVAMHGAGLRRRRYGLSPSWPSTPPAYADFVERQEARQRALAQELLEESEGGIVERDLEVLAAIHDTGSPPHGTWSRLWCNYVLLQAWDTLSLSFCETASPPQYREVGPVPAGASDHGETLGIEPLGEGSFEVDPYPFDVDPLVASVPTRIVRASTFDDEEELVRAYYESERERETFELRRADTTD